MEETLATSAAPAAKFRLSKRNVVILVVVGGVAVIACAIWALAYYSPEAVASRDLEQTIAKAGKLMLLPEGETPALATVADPSKLVDQPFFRNALIGDKVLIYPVSRRAIIYSPSRDKIIEVAPVNLGEPSTEALADEVAL
jgi:hypothetical protein